MDVLQTPDIALRIISGSRLTLTGHGAQCCGAIQLMSKTRHILAVVAVATALCADQAVIAAPAPGPHVAEIAAKLVERLSKPFRRTVPSAVRPIDRSRAAFAQLPTPSFPSPAISAPHRQVSPFQFRLPPPTV
jgi:hypothetical protein